MHDPAQQGFLGRFRAKLELRRLKKLPRYQAFSTRLFGPELHGVDGRSFYHSFREIFVDRIYEFATDAAAPRIVDAGSNIGLSLLFFKHRYPDCQLTGFEPDPNVFKAVQQNMKSFQHCDIELVQKAVWTEETVLTFQSEGADAGHLSSEPDGSGVISVDACSLRPFLQQPVDFLKMDIEGSEVDVLLDCADDLPRVSNLFVEYHSFADQPQRLHELIAVLAAAGFRYQIQTQFASKNPFCELDLQLGMDLQLNVFAYRETQQTSDSDRGAT